MAEPRWRWNRWEWDALFYFRRVAADGAGYRLHGVRGWAHLNDLQEANGRGHFEVLPRLHARGLLDRADVSAPRRARPEWVYRIAERGVQVAGARDPTLHPSIPPPRTEAEPAVYAPSRQRGALQLLRAAYDDPTVPASSGGRGWVTGRELGARVEAANRELRGTPFFAVDATDLRWLVDKGLCERRNDPERRGIVWWRVTDVGRSVHLLEWKPTPPDSQRRARLSGRIE